MATKKSVTSPKKRQLKAVTTVREKASLSATARSKKPRKIRGVASIIWRPFKLLYAGLKRLLRPFSFILIPFKTRPVRAVGRFMASVFLLRYFRDSWKELMKVEWPDARETTKLTIAVFIFAIFFSLLISLADFGLDKAFQKLIIK